MGGAPRRLTIAALTGRFPDFRVAVVVATLPQAPASTPALEAFARAAEEEARARWAGVELSAIPGVAAWRAAYRAFGIRKTSYRSSVERLLKRVLAGEALPAIHPLVDLYNAVSIESGLCVGADDLDKVAGDLAFRFAREGDSFLDMAPADGDDPADPPKSGEVVYACDDHVLCRRWNWRQDARSRVTDTTRRVVVTFQSNGFGDVAGAADAFSRLAASALSARCAAVLADGERPVVELPTP